MIALINTDKLHVWKFSARIFRRLQRSKKVFRQSSTYELFWLLITNPTSALTSNRWLQKVWVRKAGEIRIIDFAETAPRMIVPSTDHGMWSCQTSAPLSAVTFCIFSTSLSFLFKYSISIPSLVSEHRLRTRTYVKAIQNGVSNWMSFMQESCTPMYIAIKRCIPHGALRYRIALFSSIIGSSLGHIVLFGSQCDNSVTYNAGNSVFMKVDASKSFCSLILAHVPWIPWKAFHTHTRSPEPYLKILLV